MKLANEQVLRRAYNAYNSQDSDTLLTLVSEDVDWPNGRARIHGKSELRAYWVEQWTRIRTHDELVSIKETEPDQYIVRISQMVRSLDGSIVSRGEFDHIHEIRNGSIVRMDIREVSSKSEFVDN